MVRGTFVKFMVRTVKRYEGAAADQLRSAFPDELRARIREVPRLAWVPAELLRETYEAIYRAVGHEEARNVWRAFYTECIDLPLVKPLASSGLALFGRNPAGLIRRTPQAWSLVTRHCGQMACEDGASKQELKFLARNLPDAMRTRAFAVSFEGGFTAQIDFVGFQGSVDTDLARLSDGEIACHIAWQPRD